MAGKSPAELKSEGEELKTLFAKIKKKPHNCAILMSKDGVVVEAHVKKSAEILVKAAKKKGGTAKGAWGVITMEGQVLILDPVNDKVPGNLTKIAKKFFAERGLKNRLEIKEPEEAVSANEAAAPGAESPVEGDDGASEDEDNSEDKRANLQKQLDEIQADINELDADTENVMHSALQDALRAHQRNTEAEDFGRAEDSLKNIKSVLEDYDGLMAEKRPLMQRMAKLEADAKKVAEGDDSEAAEGIGRAQRAFVGAIDNNEWNGAREQLDKIEALIENAGAAESPGDTSDSNEERATPNEPDKSTDTAEDSPASGGGDSEEDRKRAELERQVAEIQANIDELKADTGNVMHSALMDALRAHERAMGEGEFERANDTLAKIKSVLEDYEGLMVEKRPLMQRMDKMQADAEKVINGDNAAAAEDVARAQRAFVGAIDNNEWFSAGEQLDKIAAQIEAAGLGGGDEAETSDQAPETGQAPQDTSGSDDQSNENGDQAVREAAKAKRKTVISKMLERLKSMNADLK